MLARCGAGERMIESPKDRSDRRGPRGPGGSDELTEEALVVLLERLGIVGRELEELLKLRRAELSRDHGDE